MLSFIILFMLIVPSFYLYTLCMVPFYFFRNYFANIYYNYCHFLLYLSGVKIYTNENFLEYANSRDKNVIIANHLSEIDYIFVFILQSYKKLNNKFIFVMKNVLRYIFFSFGWASFINDSLFLKRNYVEDIKYMNTKLKNIKKYDKNCQILIFPEGYIYTSEKFLENIKYCNENNILKYDNLLHPRTKGCNLIQTSLNINTIYDITILYDTLSYNNLMYCYNIANIIKYNIFPRNIYLHIEKYNMIFDKNNYHIIFDKKDKVINDYLLYNENYTKNKKYLKPTVFSLLCFIFIILLNIVGLYFMIYNTTYYFYVVFITHIFLYFDENFI